MYNQTCFLPRGIFQSIALTSVVLQLLGRWGARRRTCIYAQLFMQWWYTVTRFRRNRLAILSCITRLLASEYLVAWTGATWQPFKVMEKACSKQIQATLGTSSNQALFHKGLQMLRGEVCVPRCFFESNHPGSWVWGDHASTPKRVFGEGHDTWLYRWCMCFLGTWKRWWKLPLTMIDKDQKCHLVCVCVCAFTIYNV